MAEQGPETRPQQEAFRLKTLAEQKYTSNNLKSALKYAKRAQKLDPSLEGLPEMLTVFKILRTGSIPVFSATPESKSIAPPDYYKILQVERFSHINTIKKQYKKLALTLHPDKNPLVASEEAFKLVGEAARVLSDKIRRKEYDIKLRIEMQSRAAEVVGDGAETFWTACSTCRLLHQFERKYLGHNLMCPRCKKCFEAMEVEENPKNGENVGGGVESKERVGPEPTRVSARIRERVVKDGKVGVLEKFHLGVKRKISTVGEVLERSRAKAARNEDENSNLVKDLNSKKVEEIRNLDRDGTGSLRGLRPKRVGKAVDVEESGYVKNKDDRTVLKSRSRRVGTEVRDGVDEEMGSVGVEVLESGRAKRAKVREEETMTLAQMQMLVKEKKVDGKKLMVKEKESNNEKLLHKEKEGDKEKVKAMECNNKKLKPKENEVEKEEKKGREKRKETGRVTRSVREKRDRYRVSEDRNLEFAKNKTSDSRVDMEIGKLRSSRKSGDLEIMPVEDSDFHDFDNARREKSFKKGQVWAVYDDDDGMPRHYALIDDVSVNPFEVTLSWLEFQHYGNEELNRRQKMGFPISCGRFKVARKISIKYLNLFSHCVDNERAAREEYRIYPKKGSVWALLCSNDLNAERRNEGVKDKRCYDIIVSLSNYSDAHGLSIAFLEKVDGFRTVFMRREVGANAVQCLEKDDIKLFSHQIPAKKLTGKEAPGLPKDCWELDPASLTPRLLSGL